MIYISFTNWKKVAETTATKNENLKLRGMALNFEIDKLKEEIKELRSAEYYYDNKLQRWRNSETGQIVSAKVAMTAQLQAEREASGRPLGHYDDARKAGN